MTASREWTAADAERVAAHLARISYSSYADMVRWQAARIAELEARPAVPASGQANELKRRLNALAVEVFHRCEEAEWGERGNADWSVSWGDLTVAAVKDILALLAPSPASQQHEKMRACIVCGADCCTVENCPEPGHGTSCEMAEIGQIGGSRWVCSEIHWEIAAEWGEASPASPQDTQRWLPVSETLPPSGKAVLAALTNELGNTRVVRAYYASPKDIEGDEDFGEYDEAADTFWTPEGWYENNEYEETNWHVHDSVTHWMRLPLHPDSAMGATSPEEAP